MLSAVVENIQTQFAATQLVYEAGIKLCDEADESIAFCYLGTTASVGGGLLAFVELIAPAILPGIMSDMMMYKCE